jgi:hypothetical protein
MKTSPNAKGAEPAANIKIIKRTQYLIENKQKQANPEPKTNPFWTQAELNRTQFEPNRTQAEPAGVTINFSTAIDFFHHPCVSSQGARV